MYSEILNDALSYPSFTIYRLPGYISNIYLFDYGDRMLLIDSGSINDFERIAVFCTDILKRSLYDIKLCAVSHMHPDHAGGAVLLREKSGIPIAAHGDADKWYSGISGRIQHGLDCAMEQFVRRSKKGKLERVCFKRELNPDYILEDGKGLPVFPDWRSFHIPGHTLHDTAFYHVESKLLHLGDAIVNVNGELRLPIPVFFKRAMKASFSKVRDLDVSVILPGHGDVIRPADAARLFDEMSKKVDEPRSMMSAMAHGLSIFTPAVWKRFLKVHFR